MFNRMALGVMLGGMGLALLGTGCATSQAERDRIAEANREQARWTDDKGHYRPEWRAGINRPAGYPKRLPGDASAQAR